MTQEQLMESKLSDYIEKNKLSKEDAMKPEHFKELKKLIKQGDDKTKAAIERAFANKDSANDKKDDASTDKKEADATENKEEKKEENKEEKKEEKKDSGLSAEEKKEVADAVKSVDLDMSSVDAARKEAESNPIQGYSLSKKMYFIHAGAKKKAEEAVKKYLQKANAGEVNVKVTNSAVNTPNQSYDLDAKKYIVGIHIILDKTNVAGLRKLMAILGESKQIDEGLIDGLKSMFGRVTQAVKDGAKDVKAEAQKKIDAANEKMKELIGVLAIKAYVTHFVGKRIGDQIDKNSVFAGVNESGEMKGRISYYTAITIE